MAGRIAARTLREVGLPIIESLDERSARTVTIFEPVSIWRVSPVEAIAVAPDPRAFIFVA